MKYFFFCALAIAAISLNSCWSDHGTTWDSPPPFPSIFGVVQDDSGTGVSNALVTLMPDNITVRSNEFGTYQFNDVPAGVYAIQASINAAVSDSPSFSLTEEEIQQIDLRIHFRKSNNKAPAEPSNPTPQHSSRITDPDAVILRWQCSDPENDPLLYEVYLSPTANFSIAEKIASNLRETNLHLQPIYAPNATFYWRVIARDTAGNATVGPAWRFDTPSNRSTRMVVWLPFDSAVVNKSDIQMNTAGYDVLYLSDRYGKSRSALLTNGSTESLAQVSPNDAIDFPPYQDFSISVWIKPYSIAYEGSCIISKVETGNFDQINRGWHASLHSSESTLNRLTLRFNDLEFYGDVPKTQNGDWHHLVIVFHHATASIDVYFDSSLLTSFNDKKLFRSADTERPLSIGAGVPLQQGFDGGIDDVRLYKGALNAEEINKLFGE